MSLLLILTAVDGEIIAPTITSSSTINHLEGTVHVLNARATGTAPITWSIDGGDDAALFEIDADTGALDFLVAPDYDDPDDFNTDGIYEVSISASNGGGSDSLLVLITVLTTPDAMQNRLGVSFSLAIGM